ncbi:hypothetical protein [Nocardia huaxiensis]|uniref:DUF5666 domain-containing protein n=1 Tax=Nocardia huaxiensis TaxID=2755382 RepID=A0A7D6VHW1_9NOCA|nr:hypothetical protein [Nocardia huaxiensis]QLY30336.1 hypothetical protein H0264_35270 [Nocardia huaxiensis]UFS96029.1 hypothetical protein LPY97_36175 [Nocardia huaxiensis]
MQIRRLIALSTFAVLVPVGAVACTAEGPGSKSECDVSGCTITFDRGVNAKASVLGVDAELVAVDGNNVTLKVGGQQVVVPVGQSQPTDGLNVNVQQVTQDNVVVRIGTGIQTGN